MVLNTKTGDIRHGTVNKKKLFLTSVLGVTSLMVSVALIYFDPVLYAVQYKLRLENGSMLSELLQSRFTSTRVKLYLFNVTNAERFLAGDDEKMRLEEIGPFVYQEYRTHEDLEINKDPGIMRYTPKLETVFIPEESVGDPKNITVTAPNVAMLSATALISKYPYLVRQIYNMLAAGSRSKPFVTISAQDYIWGFTDPLCQLANNVVPGLIYYKALGVFDRFYDDGVDYRLELGTTEKDKFSVKKSTKIQPKNASKNNAKVLLDSTYTYNDTYEGAAYPPCLTPHTPISIYRQGLCKTFQLKYVTSRRMFYGGDGFVYQLHNGTFRDRQQCQTTGWCPDGLMNLADCYFGFPVVLSKGHFLDSDPRLLEKVDGLKPNRTMHDTNIVIEPKIGVGISGSMSLQMNLAIADVGYNPLTRRLKDTVVPVSNIIVSAPPIIDEVRDALHLVYVQGPYMVLFSQIACTILGLTLLLYSTRMLYWIWVARKTVETNNKVTQARWPLLVSKQCRALGINY